MRGQHGVHFRAQGRVSGANLIQERAAMVRLAREGSVEDTRDLPPPFRRHAARAGTRAAGSSVNARNTA